MRSKCGAGGEHYMGAREVLSTGFPWLFAVKDACSIPFDDPTSAESLLTDVGYGTVGKWLRGLSRDGQKTIVVRMGGGGKGGGEGFH